MTHATATTAASRVGTVGLVPQVACLSEVDANLLERMRHEVLTVPSGWRAEYGEFQSGGWWTLSLLNATGAASDVKIADCEPVETDLLAQMPVTRELLRGLGLRYMWVRLARLAPRTFLWEHRDYAELAGVERQRLHIPVLSNSSAFLVVGGTKVHLSPQRIWRLTPTYAHGVCNRLGPDRIHLILDCYADERLAALTGKAHLPAGSGVPLPALTDTDRERALSLARSLAVIGYVAEAERLLLHTFFKYRMPEGTSYDLVAELHECLGDSGAVQAWRDKKDVMLARADAQVRA